MKRSIILAMLLVPMISFGQLKGKEKKSIKKYTESVCSCVTELFNELPKECAEITFTMVEEGEEAAMQKLQQQMAGMSEEELTVILQGFEKMSSPEFGAKIEACDDKSVLNVELADGIDNASGSAYDYFISQLESIEGCKLMNALYTLGKNDPVE